MSANIQNLIRKLTFLGLRKSINQIWFPSKEKMKKCRALIEKSDDGIKNFFSNAVLSLGRFSNNHFNRTCINSSYQTGKLNVHRICTDPWFSDKNFNFQTSWKGECPDRIHAPQWGLCGDRQVTKSDLQFLFTLVVLVRDFESQAMQSGSEDPEVANVLQKCEEYVPGKVPFDEDGGLQLVNCWEEWLS